MRVILDTNILIAALLVPGGTTDTIVKAWRSRTFTLLTCDEQIDELHVCPARPRLVPARIRRHKAGRLINTIRRFAEFVGPLPDVVRSADPNDDFLLALAQAGAADYLVSGDKAGLPTLRTHRGTRIVSAGEFVRLL